MSGNILDTMMGGSFGPALKQLENVLTKRLEGISKAASSSSAEFKGAVKLLDDASSGVSKSMRQVSKDASKTASDIDKAADRLDKAADKYAKAASKFNKAASSQPRQRPVGPSPTEMDIPAKTSAKSASVDTRAVTKLNKNLQSRSAAQQKALVKEEQFAKSIPAATLAKKTAKSYDKIAKEGEKAAAAASRKAKAEERSARAAEREAKATEESAKKAKTASKKRYKYGVPFSEIPKDKRDLVKSMQGKASSLGAEASRKEQKGDLDAARELRQAQSALAQEAKKLAQAYADEVKRVKRMAAAAGAGGAGRAGGGAPPAAAGGAGGGGGGDEDGFYDEIMRQQAFRSRRAASAGRGYTREEMRKTVSGGGAAPPPTGGGGGAAPPPTGGGGAGGGTGGSGGGFGGGEPPRPPKEKWAANIQELWNSITRALDPKQLKDIDLTRVTEAAPYRQLAGRHAKEAAGAEKVASPEKIGKLYSEFTTTTKTRMRSLVDNLESLVKVSEAPGIDPASTIQKAVRDIRKLSSKGGEGVDVQGARKEINKFTKTTTRIVQTSLKTVIGKLLEENYDLEKKIRQAEAESKPEVVAELSRMFVSNIKQMQQIYDAAEAAGSKFNINLQQTAKGKPQRPGGVIPEAEFRGQGANVRRIQQEFKELPLAQEAIKAARNFEGMEDSATRIRAAFKVLFSKMGPESLEFRKNLTGVVEGLKVLSTKGLINRREVEDTAGVMDSYLNKMNRLRQGEEGLGGGPVKIPGIFNLAGEGGPGAVSGSERELYKQIDRVRANVAKRGAKGKGPTVAFEFEDASGALRKLNVQYKKLGNTLDAVTVKAQENTKVLSTREQMGLAFRRVALWGTAAGLTYGAIQAFREAINVMKDAEEGVVSLSKVMGEADELGMEEFTDTINRFVQDLSVKFAASLRESYDVMRIFAQQGKNLAEVQKLTAASFLGANISILSQKDVAEALTAVTKQFNVEASEATNILDAWNEVSNRNAVTMKVLADATKKAGAAASVVGIELEQFTGLVTAISEATRKPGKEIGTSLRFIFQRTLRPETKREIARVGVATEDLKGNFKGFIPVLTELADKWDTLTKAQKLSVAQALGGARQYNAFLALMENYDTAVKSAAEAVNSQGSAQRENNKYMSTAAARMKKTQAAVHSLYVNLSSSLLPVIKKVTDTMTSLAKMFQAMPNWLKLSTVGFVGFAAVLSKVASNLDYVLAGTAATGGGFKASLGALAGGAIGRAKTPEQLGSLEQRVALTSGARSGKQVSDLGGALGISALGMGAGEAFEKQGSTLKKMDKSYATLKKSAIDSGKAQVKWVDATKTNMSKLTAVVKGYGVQMKGSTETAKLGLSSLNSPILMVIGLMAKLGQTAASALLAIPFYLARGITRMVTFGRVSIKAAHEVASAWIKTRGVLISLGAFAVASYVIYKIYDVLSDTEKQARKTGKQLEESLAGELSKREKALSAISNEIALLQRLEKREKKLASLRDKSTAERARSAQEGAYKSPLLEQIRLQELNRVGGASLARVDPTAIRDIDKFGRVTLETGDAMLTLSRSAQEAKAQLVALTKTKIAVGFAGDVNKAFKDLTESVKEYKAVLPAIQAGANLLGQYEGQSEHIYEIGNSLIRTQDQFNNFMKLLKDTLAAFPESTPIESFMVAMSKPEILRAFEKEAEAVSKALVNTGRSAATAYDVINQVFLRSRGIKEIGVTGGASRERLRERNVVSEPLREVEKQVESGQRRLSGKELITFGKEGPFGLSQARLYLDTSGEYMVEGISKFGQKVQRSLADVRSRLKKGAQALVFDPSTVIQEFTNSIQKVQKQIGGAGAGLIKFPAEVDLGVKFRFQLGDADYLQTAGEAIQDLLAKAASAQASYSRDVEEFIKTAKENPIGEISNELQNHFNNLARRAAQLTFFVSLSNEISKLGKAAEQAWYDMRRANISDRVEQQFATMTTSAKGFAEELKLSLPKLGSELSSEERVAQRNPDLVRAARAAERASTLVKEQTKQTAVLTQLDLPKMFAESGAADVKRFVDRIDQDRRSTQEAMRRFGGDKKFAELSKSQDKTTQAVRDSADKITRAIDKQSGKAERDRREDEKTAYDTTVLDRLVSRISKEGTISVRSWSQNFSKSISNIIHKIRQGEARQRAKAGQGYLRRNEEGVVTGVVPPDYRKIATDIYRKSGGEITETQGREFKDRWVKYLDEALEEASAGISSEPQKESDERTLLSWAVGKIRTGWGDWFEKNIQKPAIRFFDRDYKKYYGKANLALQDVVPRIFESRNIAQGTDVTAFTDALKSIRKRETIRAELSEGEGRLLTDKEVIAKSNEAAKEAIVAFTKATETITKTIGKQIQKQRELINGLAVAAVAAEDFSSSVDKSLRGIISSIQQERVLGPLSAPLVGAAAGIPQGQKIDTGKGRKDLSAYESLYKRFPGFVRNLTVQEQARQKVLSELPGIYSKLQENEKRLVELSENAPVEQQRRYQEILGTGRGIFNRVTNAVKRMNGQMTPLLKTFGELSRLEDVKRSLEGVVGALKKAEDLEFDTASIDRALGRHPLASTGGVYGQPAGLNKFERRLFELEQRKDRGEVGGRVYGRERDKIEFEKKEALIQYRQSKETAKLSQEIDAAKRAMDLLWEAQYQGISGLQPIISTLKSELSTAGETYEVGGERYFQGVPSLRGIQKEIARVQEQKRAKNFREQRDIVMKGVEELLRELVDVNKRQAEVIKKSEEDLGAGDTISRLNDIVGSFVKGDKTLRDGIVAALASIAKVFGAATGLGGTEDDVGKLGELNTKFADSMRQSSESFRAGTEEYQGAVTDFKDAAKEIVRAADKLSTKPAGERVITTRPLTAAEEESKLERNKGGSVPGKYAQGGYIQGKPGVDTISAGLAPGSFVVSRKAVQQHGLPFFNSLSSGGSSPYGSVPAKVSSGEFVVPPDAVGKIGIDQLEAINKGKVKGFEKGGAVGEYTIDQYRTRSMMTMEGLRAIQRISSNTKLSQEEKAKKLNAIYTDPKYRKEVKEKEKRKDISDRLVGERLGRGGGYIKVGDKYIAMGEDPDLGGDKARAERLKALRRAASLAAQDTSGKTKEMTLRALGEGSLNIKATRLDAKDRTFVKALRSGMTVGEYKKHIEETTKPVDTGKLVEAVAGARRFAEGPTDVEAAQSKSSKLFSDFMKSRLTSANIRYEDIEEALVALGSAKNPLERKSAMRRFVLEQQAGATELERSRANVASIMQLLSKKEHFAGRSWVSESLQRYADIGGYTKANPTINYGDKNIPLKIWRDPDTGVAYLVNAESETPRYKDFRIEVTQAMRQLSGKGRTFLQLTGGMLSAGIGKGAGVGAIDLGRSDRKRKLSYGLTDVRSLEAPPEVGGGDFADLIGGPLATTYGVGESAVGSAKGLYKIGSLLARETLVSDPEEARELNKEWGDIIEGGGKGMVQLGANLGITPPEHTGIKPETGSALYGARRAFDYVFRREAYEEGKEYSPTGRDIGKTMFAVGETAVPFGIGKLAKAGALGKLGKLLRTAKLRRAGKLDAPTFGEGKFGRGRLAGAARGAEADAAKKAGVPEGGFAKGADVPEEGTLKAFKNADALELLQEARPTLYRFLTRGMARISKPAARVMAPTRRLRKEALDAYELGISPRSKYVARRAKTRFWPFFLRRRRKEIEALVKGDKPGYKASPRALAELSGQPGFFARKYGKKLEGTGVVSRARRRRAERLDILEGARAAPGASRGAPTTTAGETPLFGEYQDLMDDIESVGTDRAGVVPPRADFGGPGGTRRPIRPLVDFGGSRGTRRSTRPSEYAGTDQAGVVPSRAEDVFTLLSQGRYGGMSRGAANILRNLIKHGGPRSLIHPQGGRIVPRGRGNLPSFASGVKRLGRRRKQPIIGGVNTNAYIERMFEFERINAAAPIRPPIASSRPPIAPGGLGPRYGAGRLEAPGGRLGPILGDLDAARRSSRTSRIRGLGQRLGTQKRERALAEAIRSGKPYSAKDIMGIPQEGYITGRGGAPLSVGVVSEGIRSIRGGVFDPSKMSALELKATQAVIRDAMHQRLRILNKVKNTEGGISSSALREVEKATDEVVSHYRKVLHKLDRGEVARYGPGVGGNRIVSHPGQITGSSSVRAPTSITEDIQVKIEELRRAEELERTNLQRQGLQSLSRRVGSAAGTGVYREGGLVTGAGGPTSDKIPAMLSNGEYVLPANVVDSVGVKTLESLRKGGVKGFQAGGYVGSGGGGSALSDFWRKAEFSALSIELADSAKEIERIEKAMAASASVLKDAMKSVFSEIATFSGPGTKTSSSNAEDRELLKSMDRGSIKDDPYLREDPYFKEKVKEPQPAAQTDGEMLKGLSQRQRGSSSYLDKDTKAVGRNTGGGPDVAGEIKAAITESSSAFASAVEGAVEKLALSISEDDIRAVGASVREGVEQASSTVSDAISGALSSVSENLSGMGAAIRPGKIEAIEGRVDILDEKIEGAKSSLNETIMTEVGFVTSEVNDKLRLYNDTLQTDLNKRFSDLPSEIAYTVRSQLVPRIEGNSESIDRVNHLALQIQALVHKVMATTGG